ncbi:MAG: TolC family protein [Chthoniobacterales bacterium]
MTTQTKVRVAAALTLLVACALPAHAITLDAALARTLEKNPAIREAQARLEQAAGRRVVLRATALPDARVLIPGGLQGGKRAGEKSPQPFAFARGLLSQPLFDLAIPPSYRRGNIEVLLAEQRLNVAVIEQLHTARVAYYTASYHDSLLTLGEAQRLRLESNARAQSDRYEAGRADRQAVTVARLLEQDVKPRVEESRRAASGALLTLARTMGDDLGPNAQLPTAGDHLSFAALSIDADAESATALKHRADLKLARLLVRAAQEDQRIIEAAYFPAIDAQISGDYIPVSDVRRGSEGSARRSDDIISSELRLGAAYTWRVVDNGKVGGAVAQRRAAREINELVVAKMEADVPRQLAQIQNNLRSIAARQTALSRATVVAEQTVADVVNNLTEGRSSQLEYRTAEASFLQSKAGLLAVAFQQNLARAELDRVTGRYFQFSDDTAGKLH